ncbi:MAG: PIN domain-containing protein [Patescibacteria group bacterium]|nr:PIN domain-containing protein [Patescibacteria group bacterium]
MNEINSDKERCFIDTNIWLYSFIETQDREKTSIAMSIIQKKEIILSTQIINEVCVNLIRKMQFPEEDIQRLIQSFCEKYSILEINKEILLKASELRIRHIFSFWDSLVVASALYSDTDILYSEDMQHGFTLENKIKIVNPFK